MKDIDGNLVNLGDVVKVIHIRDEIISILADDEKPHTLAMLNNDYKIDEFVNDDQQISVSYWVQEDGGCLYGGLYLYPHEFRLVRKRSSQYA
ncbi:hypothetical protein [Marinobacter xestospongiae]|uniref:hypothetical protein n=1 Tax=Marinobacter xestospongiae TaxID=994319 RepID=UPI0020060D50|nr:hypothetical protein [Marinobacter xestospongiae]MCK7568509.1 hypothetical protein [Marinobacter xestospongiae]